MNDFRYIAKVIRHFGLPEKMEIESILHELRFYYGNFEVSFLLPTDESLMTTDEYWLIRHWTTRINGSGLWEVSYEAKSAKELKDKVHHDLLDYNGRERYFPNKLELVKLYSKWKKLQ